MKRYLYFAAIFGAFVLPSLWGQSLTANYPGLPIVQSCEGAASANSCAFDRDVVSGDTFLACANWESSTSTPSVTGTRSTWSGLVTDTSPTVKTSCYVGTATSSGSETVVFSVSGASDEGLLVLEFPSYVTAGVLDDSAVTTFSGTPSSITSSSITTTLNNDVLIGFAGGFRSSGRFLVSSSGWLSVAFRNGDDSHILAMSIGANNGSYSVTFGNSVNDVGTLVILALKSNSLAITSDSNAPDGVLSSAYSWCVQAAGGVGSYTWSITGGSLQSGLSLNSSTGCIAGTPSVSSSNSITFQVTDGTNTATKTIGLKVGGSANTIAVVQAASGSGTTVTFASSVTAGHALVIGAAYSFNGTYKIARCTDTLGTNFRHIVAWYSNNLSNVAGNPVQVNAGIAPSSGSDTITCTSDPQYKGAIELSGVGYVADDYTMASSGVSASPVTSGTLTTPAAGSVLFSVGDCFNSSCVIAIQSPFTDVGPGSSSGDSGYDIVSTITGYTVSYTYTGNASQLWGIALAAFRPSAGSVVVAAPTGHGIIF